MAEGVWCADCVLFVQDAIGNGFGVGSCQAYESYRLKNPPAAALDSAYKRLGGQLFWGGSGGSGRNCEKYEGL